MMSTSEPVRLLSSHKYFRTFYQPRPCSQRPESFHAMPNIFREADLIYMLCCEYDANSIYEACVRLDASRRTGTKNERNQPLAQDLTNSEIPHPTMLQDVGVPGDVQCSSNCPPITEPRANRL